MPEHHAGSDIVIKPRDVMPEGARTLPARVLHRPGAASGARWSGCSGAMWICAGRVGAGRARRASSSCASCSARASSSRAAPPARVQRLLQRLPPSRHAALHRAGRAVRRQHPVPVSRLDLRPRRPADRRAAHGRSAALPEGRTIRCTASHADEWDGHIFLNLATDPRAARARSSADLPGEVPHLAHAGSPARPPHRLRRAGELEADHPELQRVPALPEPAPGAQQAVALPERRERAAARRPTWAAAWTCGRASTRCRWTARARARSCPGCSSRDGARVYYYAIFPNMLLSLHPDYMMVHTLWPMAPDRTINVCEWHFHPTELARPGFDAADCDRVLGHDEPAGLARLRAVAGGHRVARLRARARTRTARICSTRSTG